MVRRNLGLLEYDEGRPEQATRIFEQSLAGFKRVGDIVGQAYVVSQLAQLSLDKNEHELAVDQLREALAMCREISSPRVESQVLYRLGSAMLLQDRYEQAQQLMTSVLGMVQRSGDTVGESYALHSLGLIHGRLRMFVEAGRLLRRAIRLCEENLDRVGAARIRLDLAQLVSQRGETFHAIAIVEQAMMTFQELRLSLWESKALAVLEKITAENPLPAAVPSNGGGPPLAQVVGTSESTIFCSSALLGQRRVGAASATFQVAVDHQRVQLVAAVEHDDLDHALARQALVAGLGDRGVDLHALDDDLLAVLLGVRDLHRLGLRQRDRRLDARRVVLRRDGLGEVGRDLVEVTLGQQRAAVRALGVRLALAGVVAVRGDAGQRDALVLARPGSGRVDDVPVLRHLVGEAEPGLHALRAVVLGARGVGRLRGGADRGGRAVLRVRIAGIAREQERTSRRRRPAAPARPRRCTSHSVFLLFFGGSCRTAAVHAETAVPAAVALLGETTRLRVAAGLVATAVVARLLLAPARLVASRPVRRHLGKSRAKPYLVGLTVLNSSSVDLMAVSGVACGPSNSTLDELLTWRPVMRTAAGHRRRRRGGGVLLGLLTFGVQATVHPHDVPLASPSAPPRHRGTGDGRRLGRDRRGRAVSADEARTLLADKEVYGVLELAPGRRRPCCCPAR